LIKQATFCRNYVGMKLLRSPWINGYAQHQNLFIQSVWCKTGT
jgi:hypothetical protein